MSIVNEIIVIHSDPRYDERDAGNPIIGNQMRCTARINYQRNICTVMSCNNFCWEDTSDLVVFED